MSLTTLSRAAFGRHRNKVITQTVLDQYLAGLPGLIHYLDPEDLGRGGTTSEFRERCGSLVRLVGVGGATEVAPLIDIDALVDAKEVFDFTDANTIGLEVQADYTPTFTIVMMAIPSAATLDNSTERVLFSVNDDVTRRGRLVILTGATKNLNLSSGSLSISWPSTSWAGEIAADVPFVVAAVSSVADTSGKLFVNDFTASKANSASQNFVAYADEYKFRFGFDFQIHNWAGKIGKILVFDRDMTLTTDDVANLTRLQLVLQSHYGIL